MTDEVGRDNWWRDIDLPYYPFPDDEVLYPQGIPDGFDPLLIPTSRLENCPSLMSDSSVTTST